MLRHRRRDLIEAEEGEELEVALHVAVVGVDPELVELVRAGALRVEPHVAALALAELGPRGRGDQGEDHPVRLCALPPADQLDPGGDVPPLVAAAHLHLALLGPEEVPEVVGLDQHVAELGVGDAHFHPAAHRFLLEHVAQREMLPDVAEEVHQGNATQPVGVVPHPGGVGPLEREEARQLPREAPGVPVDLLQAQDRPLLALPAGVTDHPRPAADQRDGRVPVTLEPGEAHHRHQAAHVQRVGRGIEAHVGGEPPFRQALRQPRGRILHEAPGRERAEQIGHSGVSYPLERGPATG
jgi:hypothetical protein